MKNLTLALGLVMIMALPALGNPNYNVCFNSLDADYDGSMSKSEFKEAFPDGDMAVYKAADSNKDGVVDHEEWEDYKASQGWEENH
jgi:hypothetical protein